MNLISPIVNRWIQDGKDNPDALWERAADELHWFRTWDKVFEWNYPSFRWFSGRADEIIKIAGHRIGTIEVKTALLKHPAVAESGVIGRPDEIRGEVISAFVLLKMGCSPSPELKKELLDTVRHDLGPVAVIGEVNFVSMLPKTRSGKIMRQVLKAVILDKDPGDITTIEDEGSVTEAREAWQQMKVELASNTN